MGLPLIRFLYRKMWNTRWLTLSSLLGLIVAVSFTTSIPMYADGALKRVVANSLQERSDGLPAGSTLIRYQATGSDRADLADFNEVDDYIATDIPEQIGFPYFTYVRSLSLRGTDVKPVDPATVDPSKRRQMTVMAMSDLTDQIEITNGTQASPTVKDGIVEAIVSEDAIQRHFFRVGDEFLYSLAGAPGQPPLHIKVVGSFKPEDPTNVYWFQGMDRLASSFIVHEDLFEQQFLDKQNLPLNLATWYYAFDLREIQTSQLSHLSRVLDRMDINLYQKLKDTRLDLSFSEMLDEFRQESLQLQFLLITLAAPMIAMVFYYIAMNARQALEKQRSDIAVLRSRGASTRQVFSIYLLEGIILGAISIVLGPLLGWFMAKSIGSSNGFLEFVNRKSVPVGFSNEAIMYGAAAVFIALLASLIPAISYARSSIVGLKQQLARADRGPLWQRWFFDILLLGVVGYGYYLFTERQFITMQSGISGDQLQVQPLLFFVPALSIFALGLFFLRLFPLLLKLFNWIGKRFLPVPLYLTLVQLSRSSKSYYPLMLLLILTLGLGVYNSSAARTIDLNSTERTLYEYGTDVVIKTAWEGDVIVTMPNQQPPEGGGGEGGGGGGGQNPGGGAPPQGPQTTEVLYSEPPFQLYKELPGVEQAARVLQVRGGAVVSGRSTGQGIVMGIDNQDFAEVAWFRADLFKPYHPNEYLNLLGQHEAAVLVSTQYMEQYQLEPGDLMQISIQGQPIEFVIMSALPYWPSQYPQETPFFIANLDYIYDQIPLIPYDVWLKMEDQALLTPVVEKLIDQGIEIVSYQDVRSELITQKRHPSRGGVFGILSLGFLVSVLVSLIGYLLYWFFNLSSRVVQFGILRAMGLSRKQLTGMLLLEQGFTAGLSIALGIGLGKLTSILFLPFLQTTGEAQKQVPPFRVVFESSDTNQLYIVVGVMMITGATMLLLHIRRLRVHQAVKLGEER